MVRVRRNPETEPSRDESEELTTLARKGIQDQHIKTTRQLRNWQVRSNVWRPPTDVYETEESLVVKMEIAGMRDEDFEVVLQDRYLLINGSRSEKMERKAYHQMEIPFGKFSVGIEIPTSIESDDTTAEYKDGFLTITLPISRLAGDFTIQAPAPKKKKKNKR